MVSPKFLNIYNGQIGTKLNHRPTRAFGYHSDYSFPAPILFIILVLQNPEMEVQAHSRS